MHFEDIDVQFLSPRHEFEGCGPNCPIGTAAINVQPSVCGLTPHACPAPGMVGSLSKDLWLQAGPPAPPRPPPPRPPPSPTPSYKVFNRTSNLAPDEKLPSTAVAGSTTGSPGSGYHITFLGNFSTWQGCRDNAAERYMPLANSWTWFSPTATTTAMASTCFAHRDGVWHPHTEVGAVAGNSTG